MLVRLNQLILRFERPCTSSGQLAAGASGWQLVRVATRPSGNLSEWQLQLSTTLQLRSGKAFTSCSKETKKLNEKYKWKNYQSGSTLTTRSVANRKGFAFGTKRFPCLIQVFCLFHTTSRLHAICWRLKLLYVLCILIRLSGLKSNFICLVWPILLLCDSTPFFSHFTRQFHFILLSPCPSPTPTLFLMKTKPEQLVITNPQNKKLIFTPPKSSGHSSQITHTQNIYIYIYIYIYTHTHTHVYINICTHTHIHINICTHTHYIYIYIYIYTHIHINICTHTHYIYIYIHTHIYI